MVLYVTEVVQEDFEEGIIHGFGFIDPALGGKLLVQTYNQGLSLLSAGVQVLEQQRLRKNDDYRIFVKLRIGKFGGRSKSNRVCTQVIIQKKQGMVSLKGEYLISLPNILWSSLNTFCEHLQCGAKLAPEGVIKVLLGHRG